MEPLSDMTTNGQASGLGGDIAPAVWWDREAELLALVDQAALPLRYEVLRIGSAEQVAEAIRNLRVRGAPAIGVAAAYGLALGARELHRDAQAQTQWDAAAAVASLSSIAERLRSTRPTAVNLEWALTRMLESARRYLASGELVVDVANHLLEEAHRICAEDVAACRAMGEIGATLIEDGDVVLTHCNAGALATSGMGTALAPIFIAHRAGKRVTVYVDETRPVLQGARLTAWELQRAGVPVVLITDNMAAHFMRAAGIKAVFVGADRIAANGDVANKIGTYGLAVLAREHGIPLYVVAPRSTVDLALPDGTAIPIEERKSEEITSIGGTRIAPIGIPVANPAFDITPARYVSAIITEAGIIRAPYETGLLKQFN